MASFLFDGVTDKMADALFDWASIDARVLLLDATGGAPVASQATVAAVLGTATESTAANYVRKALTGEAIVDSGSTRIFTATSPVWTALGSTSDQLGGAVLYAHVTSDSDSWPIGFYAEADQILAGVDYEMTITSSGLFQLAKV